MKNFRHHLDKFFMIVPVNLFKFSTSTTCIQMQSDLYVQRLWLREPKLDTQSVQTENE